MRARFRPALSSAQIEILSEDLNVRYYAALGLAQMLWHATAEHAPCGNIGRWSNLWIAKSLRWDGDPDTLITGLVAAGLLDEDPDLRLVVSSWPQIAGQHVHRRLARARLYFADGSPPRWQRRADFASRPDDVEAILADGARRAREIARPILDACFQAAGIGPPG